MVILSSGFFWINPVKNDLKFSLKSSGYVTFTYDIETKYVHDLIFRLFLTHVVKGSLSCHQFKGKHADAP